MILFWELRQAYLMLGFEETINPLFIEEDHVYRQFGPEAPAVLDRCFYLAGLPRPDIGLRIDKIEKIEGLGVSLDEEKINGLQEVFRQYKKGETSGDDLVLDLSCALDVENEMGMRVLERVFPEFHELKPVASKTTLRSHMTSGWFITLQNLYKKRPWPLKLFSIDRCFRREQKEDSSHRDTRSLTFELSPPILYQLGLGAGLEWLFEQIHQQYGLEIAFEDDKSLNQLDDDILELLFRGVRELLINVAKHAQAKKVNVSTRRNDNNLYVCVKVDGIGMQIPNINLNIHEGGGFGLFSIKERLEHLGGQLTIDSQPACGSAVTLIAPLKDKGE